MHRRLSLSEHDTLDLEKLREMAKIASIYHKDRKKYQRNPRLSHVAHAGLHIFQFLLGLLIITFHHVHHHVNRGIRDTDDSVPHLPEETNFIFSIYPLCMLISIVCAVLWLTTKIFTRHAEIALIGCFASAALMLVIGIIEMKHVDMYLDLTVITDEELLRHPIFIHNFIMCLLSVFNMCIYLIQGWTLYDYYFWRKKHETRAEDIETVSARSQKTPTKYDRGDKEMPGQVDPIATLGSLPTIPTSEPLNINDEPAILYCCCVDWFNHIRMQRDMKHPLHEFQVIHVL